MAFGTTTVVGKYEHLDGTPVTGTVSFTGKVVVTSASDKTVIVPTTVQAKLVQGSFSVELPATNDPDICRIPFQRYNRSRTTRSSCYRWICKC